MRAEAITKVARREAGSVGARTRRARELRGMTQGELARKSGLHPATVSNLETGKRAPSAISLVRVALALMTSPDALLGFGVFVNRDGTETLLSAQQKVEE